MLKKIEKLRDLASDVESHLEESRTVIDNVIELLEGALALVEDIKDDEKESIENYLEKAVDQIGALGNAL